METVKTSQCSPYLIYLIVNPDRIVSDTFIYSHLMVWFLLYSWIMLEMSAGLEKSARHEWLYWTEEEKFQILKKYFSYIFKLFK